MRDLFCDALEAAFLWAFCCAAFYALLFVDLSGSGGLVDAARALARESFALRIPAPGPVMLRRLPASASAAAEASEARLLGAPSPAAAELAVPVLAGR